MVKTQLDRIESGVEFISWLCIVGFLFLTWMAFK